MEHPANEPPRGSNDNAEHPLLSTNSDATHEVVPGRRSFFGRLTSVVMAFGMSVGYGLFGWIIGRFMYSNGGKKTQWQFVARLDDVSVGQGLTFVSPTGQRIVLTRLEEAD